MRTKSIQSALVILLITALIITFLLVAPAFAQTGPTKNAQTGINVDDGGVEWSSPWNITTVDSPYASVVIGGSDDNSDFLRAANYGFTSTEIPDDAIITGITVTVQRRGERNNVGGGVYDRHIYLVKDNLIQTGNAASGRDKADTSPRWPEGTMTPKTYGGPDDMWGNSWTPEEIRSPTFGVALSVHTGAVMSFLAEVDYIKVTVTYASKMYSWPPSSVTFAPDGYIRATSSTYSGARSAASGIVDINSTTFKIGQALIDLSPTYEIDRGFIYLDTSAIPDNAMIVDATLYLYGAVDNSGTDFSLDIVGGTYPSLPLAGSDFAISHYTTIGGTLSTSGFTTAGYNAIPLNSNGLGWISKTGTTKLGILSSRDVLNNTPTGSEYVVVYSADYEGTTRDPYLLIKYENSGNLDPIIISNGGGPVADVYVAENQTAVTTVTATDLDPGTTLTYSIIGGADSAKFSIAGSTGVLTFVSAPNFESPIDADGNNVYDVTVRVSDNASPTPAIDTQTIYVTVINVNEAPVITSNGGGATASVSIPETDRLVTTVTATDEDAGNTLTYSKSGGADASRMWINPTTGMLYFFNIPPNFETPLDADQDNVYVVTIQVSDNASPPAIDTQTFYITVTDVNEPPTIINSGGIITVRYVPENSTAVSTVTATDPDIGDTLTFSISDGQSDGQVDDSNKFNIVGSTGVLTFVTPPDFENPTDAYADNIYMICVTVSDGALTNSRWYEIHVYNVLEPIIHNITPNNGTVAGGTVITIDGNNYESPATVTIGGNPATDVNVVNFYTITATTPASATPGAKDVVVTGPNGSGTSIGGFSYTNLFLELAEWNSCPFAYSWDGEVYNLENDIYSVARGKANEFTDYLLLQNAVEPKDGSYTFEIREIPSEESWTDTLKLITIDHPVGTKVGVDSAGNVHTFVNPSSPISAVDGSGADVLALITSIDSSAVDMYQGDTITLDFSSVDIAEGAKIVLRVDGFEGEAAGAFNPDIPAIQIQTLESGQWVTRHRFFPKELGTEGVFDIKAYLTESKTVRLVSVSCLEGKYHRVDYVGLDNTADVLRSSVVEPSTVILNGTTDILGEVNSSDNVYAYMMNNDIITVTFPANQLAGKVRDFVLVSEGYYQPTANTFYIYTWDGSSWVERATQEGEGLMSMPPDQVWGIDTADYLPDPDGEYKIKIKNTLPEIPAVETVAVLDQAYMIVDGSIYPASYAKESDTIDILTQVVSSDDVKWDAKNKWAIIKFGPESANVAPVLDAIGNQNVVEGNLLTFTAMATHADTGQTLTFSLIDGISGDVPDGASITSGGLFTWTPTEAQGPGIYTFDVVVTDDGSPPMSDGETITVTVNEIIEDSCPFDPDKIAPGICGCGVADIDTDNDGTADCNDGCPSDPNKVTPGICGCGVADTDSDGDGTPDCNDGCPADPAKTVPGVCGCGIPDTDSDIDGTPDCSDLCPTDPNKVNPGTCGCGFADTDSDIDGTPDCNDLCPNDRNKTAPGACGCGVPDTDSDGDGTVDCNDGCPSDPNKVTPGVCGCGVADTDTDSDVTPDCIDNCPNNPNPDQVDSDGDGIGDVCDNHAPVADNDVYTTDEDVILNIAAPGVLDGDTDIEGNSLIAVLVDGVEYGTLTLNSDGSFSYDPDDNWSGTDSFIYKASDGELDSNPATVTITVNPINDLPVISATNVTVTVNEGQTADNTGIYSDVEDGDSVTISASVGIVTQDSGTWSWSFATTDGNDESQTVTITAMDSDGASNTTTFSLTVNNVAPMVAADKTSITVDEGATAENTGTFSDPGADTVSVTASVGSVTHGEGTWNWSFATTDGNDESQTVTITAMDSDGASNTTTFSLTVNNVAPMVAADKTSITVDEGATAENTGTFSDPGADTVSVTASVGSVTHGEGTWNWSFATTDGNDESQTVTIKATDSDGEANITTFALTVNDLCPVATNNTITAQEDTDFIFVDADFAFADVAADTLTDVEITTLPVKGTLKFDGLPFTAPKQVALADIGKLAYKAALNDFGANYATFTFKIETDNVWSIDAATMTIDVSAVDDAPEGNAVSDTQPAVQYSDPIDPVTITAIDIDDLGTALSVSYSYKKDGGSSTPGLPLNLISTLTSTTDGGLTFPGGTPGSRTWTVDGNVGVEPGVYEITATVTDDSDGSYGIIFSILVEPEGTEHVGEKYWAGEDIYFTPTDTSNTATVTLVATLRDAADPWPGDIRNATVSFFVSTDGSEPWSPIPSAQNLPVGLVDPSDRTTGTASAIAQFNLGANGIPEDYYIKIVVGGCYTAQNEINPIIVTRNIPGQVVGNPTLDASGSSGYIKGLISSSTIGLMYTNKGTNIKGRVTLYIDSMYKADGKLDDHMHYYQVTTNALATLSVTTGISATFSGKATVKELDIPGGNFINTLDAGAVLQISLQKKTGIDYMAVAVQKSSKSGGLWFSSQWDGKKTIMDTITGGTLLY